MLNKTFTSKTLFWLAALILVATLMRAQIYTGHSWILPHAGVAANPVSGNEANAAPTVSRPFAGSAPVPNRPLATNLVATRLVDYTFQIPADTYIDPDRMTGDPSLVYTVSGLPAGNLNFSSGSRTISGRPNVGGVVLSLILRVTDKDMLMASQPFSLTINDNFPPALTNPIASQTATIGQPYSVTTGNVFTDPEGLPLTVSVTGYPAGLVLTSGVISGTPTAIGSSTIVIRATDAVSQTAITTFTLQVLPPNRPPTVVSPIGNKTAVVGVGFSASVAANFNDPESQNLSYTSVGLPPGLSISPQGLISGLASTTSTNTVTVTATDPGSLSVSNSFVLSVVNSPPTTTGISNQSYTVGTPVSLNIASSFSDLDVGQLLTYQATGLPGSLTLLGSTISGTPTGGGSFTVTVTATDPGSQSVSTSFTININSAPTVAQPVSPQSATVGIGYTLSLAGAFTDAETPNGLVLTTSTLPAGLSLTGSSITGTPSSTVGSPVSVTVTATDPGNLSASTSFVLTIVPFNSAPTVGQPVSPQSATVGVAYTLSLAGTFTDAETPNGLVLTTSTLPAGLNLTGSSITGTPSSTVGSPVSVTVTATDPGNLSASTSFVFTIVPFNSAPTVAQPVSPQSATVGVAYTLSLAGTFTDAETPNGLALSTSTLPAGLSLIGSSITGTPSSTVGSPVSVTVKATDPGNLSASTSFVLTIVPFNSAPTVAQPVSPQSATVGVGYTLSLAGTFTDAETPNRLVLTTSTLPAGLSLSGSNITGTPSSTVGSPVSVTVTATDPGNLSVSTSFVLTIVPFNSAPTVAQPVNPQSATVGVAYTLSLANTFTDAETPNGLVLTTSTLPAGLSLTGSSITGTPSSTVGSPVSVTVTATDPGNLSASTSFVITIVPFNSAPTVAQPVSPQSATVGVAYTLSLVGTFTDAETPNQLALSTSTLPAGLSLTGTSITGTPSSTVGSPVSVTVTATDPGNLSASTSFVLTIVPFNSAPTVAQPVSPQSATVGVAYTLSLAGTFTDAETPNGLALSTSTLPAGLSLTGTSITGTPSSTVGSPVSVTVTATDPGNLSASTSFAITIVPFNSAPTVAQPVSPQSATVGVAYTLSLANTFTDAQTPNGLILSTSTLPAGLSLTGSSITGTPSSTVGSPVSVTVTATDPGNLSASTSFVITIVPFNSAPTVAQPVSPQSATVGVAYTLSLANTFTDAQTPNGLILSTSTLPAGLSLTGSSITGTPSSTVGSPVSVTVTATDPGNLSASTSFVITIVPFNSAPTVAQPVSPQSATVGVGYTLSLVGTFTDAETPNQLALSTSTLPAGLSLSGSNITGTPSSTVGSPVSVTVTATDPGNLSANTLFTLSVSPAVSVTVPGSSFAITGVTTVSCATVSTGLRRVSFTPQYAGLNGSPVSFSVTNELAPTTAPGPYTLNLYTDNPTITLVAVQSNAASRLAYNWLAACTNPATGNQAPVVANPIGPQTAVVNQTFSLNVSGTFSDPNGDALTLSAAGLPVGLSLSNNSISGVPSATGVSSVTLTATDGGGLSTSTTFTLSVLSSGAAPFAITGVTTVNCAVLSAGQRSVSFTPQYAGLNGSPVSFSVVHELAPTTAAGPYTLRLYTDNPTITLVGVQGGTSSSFAYNWLAACTNSGSVNLAPVVANPIAAQTATVNQPFSLNVASTFSDPNGDALTLSAAGLPAGLSLAGNLISGVPSATGVSSVTLTATDGGGLSTGTTFSLSVLSSGVAPFAITGVTTVSCATVSAGLRRVSFTPQYTGLNGSPVSFSVANELAPTTAAGPYTLSLYTDNPIITAVAVQGNASSRFAYNWLVACAGGSGRISAEPTVRLKATLFPNPVVGEEFTVDIDGAEGQTVRLHLLDLQGNSLTDTSVKVVDPHHKQSVRLGQHLSGMYLLQVSTPGQSVTLKVIRN